MKCIKKTEFHIDIGKEYFNSLLRKLYIVILYYSGKNVTICLLKISCNVASETLSLIFFCIVIFNIGVLIVCFVNRVLENTGPSYAAGLLYSCVNCIC